MNQESLAPVKNKFLVLDAIALHPARSTTARKLE
jgi:hypothetical protein